MDLAQNFWACPGAQGFLTHYTVLASAEVQRAHFSGVPCPETSKQLVGIAKQGVYGAFTAAGASLLLHAICPRKHERLQMYRVNILISSNSI